MAREQQQQGEGNTGQQQQSADSVLLLLLARDSTKGVSITGQDNGAGLQQWVQGQGTSTMFIGQQLQGKNKLCAKAKKMKAWLAARKRVDSTMNQDKSYVSTNDSTEGQGMNYTGQ